MMIFSRKIRRFTGDTSAAAAIEFAFIIPIFLAIVFALLETGWLMTRIVMLDTGLDRTVRALRIGATLPGAAAGDPITQESVRKAVCTKAMVFIDCEKNLLIEMILVQNGNLPKAEATCIDRSDHAGGINPVVSFTPGGRDKTMFIRACVTVTPITPVLGPLLAQASMAFELLDDAADGTYSISSASAFINEPA